MELDRFEEAFIDSYLHKHYRTNFQTFVGKSYALAPKWYDKLCRIYQREWEKKITRPELTSETKNYILNDVIADESPNDTAKTKEEIDYLTNKNKTHF